MTKIENGVPALDRALDILELVARDKSVGFGQMVEELELPTASAARIFKRLCARGYLVKDLETGHYRMGNALTTLVAGRSESELLQKAAQSTLKKLRDEIEQTAILFYWNGGTWECVDKALHEHSYVMQTVGEIRRDVFEYPWSCFIYDELRKAKSPLCEQLKVGDRKRLRSDLAHFKKAGFVVSRTFLGRLTAPLYRCDGSVVGALALGVTLGCLDDVGSEIIGQRLMAAREQIQNKLVIE